MYMHVLKFVVCKNDPLKMPSVIIMLHSGEEGERSKLQELAKPGANNVDGSTEYQSAASVDMSGCVSRWYVWSQARLLLLPHTTLLKGGKFRSEVHVCTHACIKQRSK